MKEYAAMRQLLELTCHNCHAQVVIDPTDPAAAEQIGDWLKVQKSDGEGFGFCGVDCLQKGAHFFRPKSGIELVGA